MDETTDRQTRSGGGFVVLRYWHVFIMLLVQLVGLAYMYGRLSQNVEDVIKRLDSQDGKSNVSREEFSDFRQEVREDVRQLHLSIMSIKGDK
jgi:hypothetical protein